MPNQVGIFWDPNLQALVAEVPDPEADPAYPPILVGPDDFMASPNQFTMFVPDPNAPLGSFWNPIPAGSTSAAAAAATSSAAPNSPPNTPAASPAPDHAPPVPSGLLLFPTDPTAPLGSFRNPYPQSPPEPNPELTPPPAPADLSSPPSPSQDNNLDTRLHALRHEILEDIANASPPSAAASATVTNPIPQRRVHFDDEDRLAAANDAAERAAARAAAMRDEVRRLEEEWTDPAPPPPRRNVRDGYRHVSSSSPPPPPSSTHFSHSASSRQRTRTEVWEREEYETWPPCMICEDNPRVIMQEGVGFCAACYGSARAEERVRWRR